MVGCVFFFKQKTAYEMRISDWSSDVCSSDLLAHRGPFGGIAIAAGAQDDQDPAAVGRVASGLQGALESAWLVGVVDEHREGLPLHDRLEPPGHRARFGQASREIGRASCRERVCR